MSEAPSDKTPARRAAPVSGHAGPDILLKDTLRGLRFALRSSGKKITDPDHPLLPEPINSMTTRAFKRIDRIARDLEETSSHVIGGPLKKSAIPDAGFFSEAGFDLTLGQQHPEAAAEALYAGLRYAAKSFTDKTVLVSEAVCLDCIRSLSAGAADGSPADHGVRLFETIRSKHVFRLQQPLESVRGESFHQALTGAGFATALWFFVPRDINTVPEDELLDMCCDVSRDRLEELDELIENGTLSGLFEELISII